jgi:hypothetical protein
MRLVICDHLSWQDDEHLLTLQAKINRFCSFLESGEVYATFPAAKGLNFAIEIPLHRPSELALAFLDRAKSLVEEAGFAFNFGPGAAGYADDAA